MPATDGLYIGNNTRRWNLLLKKILAGEEPATLIDGRLWFYDVDKHMYLEDEDAGYRKIPFEDEVYPHKDTHLTGQSDAFLPGDVIAATATPAEHGNEAHNPDFLYTYTLSGAYYAAADVTIGSAAAVTIASFTALINEWNLPSGGFNFRPAAANTADRTLSVWWESPSGTQRSAKFPITVKLGEIKHPLSIGVPLSGVSDLAFWGARFPATQSIFLKGQTDAESVIVSDRYISNIRVK